MCFSTYIVLGLTLFLAGSLAMEGSINIHSTLPLTEHPSNEELPQPTNSINQKQNATFDSPGVEIGTLSQILLPKQQRRDLIEDYDGYVATGGSQAGSS